MTKVKLKIKSSEIIAKLWQMLSCVMFFAFALWSSPSLAIYHSNLFNTNYDLTNDRLSEVAYPDITATYTYDAAYNRITEQLSDNASATITVDRSYSYNNRNQLTDISDNLDPENGKLIFCQALQF